MAFLEALFGTVTQHSQSSPEHCVTRDNLKENSNNSNRGLRGVTYCTQKNFGTQSRVKTEQLALAPLQP